MQDDATVPSGVPQKRVLSAVLLELHGKLAMVMEKYKKKE